MCVMPSVCSPHTRTGHESVYACGVSSGQVETKPKSGGSAILTTKQQSGSIKARRAMDVAWEMGQSRGRKKRQLLEAQWPIAKTSTTFRRYELEGMK